VSQWEPAIDKDTTDENGWMYAVQFKSDRWNSKPTPGDQVRRRMWCRRRRLNEMDLAKNVEDEVIAIVDTLSAEERQRLFQRYTEQSHDLQAQIDKKVRELVKENPQLLTDFLDSVDTADEEHPHGN
jgi:hypothetical protein